MSAQLFRNQSSWIISLFQKTQSVKKLPVIKIENSLKPIINRYHHLVITNLSKNWWKILKTQTTMLPILKFLKSLDMMEIILSTHSRLMNSFTTLMSESISNETFGIGILRTKLSNEAHGIIPIIFSRIIRICRMQWHWIYTLTKFYTEFSWVSWWRFLKGLWCIWIITLHLSSKNIYF